MNRTKNYTKIIGLCLIIISGILQFNCKKETPATNDDAVPVLKEAPIGFAVTSNFSYNYTPASTTGPSFSDPSTVFYFQAGFNAEVTWTITINDFTSGAVKTLTGTSSTINESNGRWDGSHDGLYYFNTGDIITATLTFVGSNIKLSSGTFTITSINAFKGYTGYIMGELGYVVAETYGTFNFNIGAVGSPDLFTTSSVYLQSWPWYVTGPGSADGGKKGAYGDTPGDPFYGGLAVTNQTSANSNGSVPANVYTLPLGFAPIEGNGAYMLYGTDYNFDYFIAGIKTQTTWCYQSGAPVFSSSSQAGIPSPTFPSPDSLWFNIYIYGTGDVISQFHWNIEEDDNGDHVHYDTSEDVYYYEITTSHKGWKLISVPYSNMLTSPSPKNGGKGNHIQQTTRITAIGFQVLSNPPGQTAKVIFDYPTITIGRPYNPNL